jgi:hypothetical protein
VLGPKAARVTIVEFFDPACESCRAFYPVVKQIMAAHPKDVRVVLLMPLSIVSGGAKVGRWSGGVVLPRGRVITGHW